MQQRLRIEAGEFAGAVVEVWWMTDEVLAADLWLPGAAASYHGWTVHKFSPERARKALADALSAHLGVQIDENDLP